MMPTDYDILKVVLIGAGNVAWHLGRALSARGIRILQVVSRRLSSCRELAGEMGAKASDDLRTINRDADAYILAVPDDAIPAVAGKADFGKGILLHTAGSVPMEVLIPYADHFGVLYPLQTFTRGRKLDFNEIPLLIEASDPDSLKSLMSLAHKLTEKVEVADSATRQMLHVAAVFACNFTNHMYFTAEMLLKQHNHSLALLEPLMKETLLKAIEISPGKAQTGPALRGDLKVIRHHLDQLQPYPEIRRLYRMISRNIMKQDRGH